MGEGKKKKRRLGVEELRGKGDHGISWELHTVQMPTLGMFDGDNPEVFFFLQALAPMTHVIEHQLYAGQHAGFWGYG